MTALMHRWLQRVLEPQKANRRSQLGALPLPTADAVFVGDSITELGNWNEWFPTIRTANRGSAGETSAEVWERRDRIVGRASVVLILVGTNDLSVGVEEEAIAVNVRQLVAHLRQITPDALIVIQSVMPRHKRWAARVQSLNLRLAEVAEVTNSRFLDLWPVLAGPDHAIRPELSFDGLHLNGEGYRLWVRELRPILADADLPV